MFSSLISTIFIYQSLQEIPDPICIKKSHNLIVCIKLYIQLLQCVLFIEKKRIKCIHIHYFINNYFSNYPKVVLTLT